MLRLATSLLLVAIGFLTPLWGAGVQFAEPTFYNYKYDQLNRIKGVDVWFGFNEDSSKYNTSFAYTPAWKERFKYDGNGNILHADRYMGYPNVPLDSMDYHYTAGTNKLTHITEASDSYSWLGGTNDIETQPVNNYGYDAIGNLIRDSSENIGTNGITWNVYGKITSIDRTAATATNDTRRIEYTYDAAGNRIGKKLTKFASARVDYTWYVRDAQGNVLNVYNAARDTTGSTTLANFDLTLQESHLYGSSRLGLQYRNINAEPPSPRGSIYDYYRGYKFYEISNHLGNVVTTISDKKLGVVDPSNSTRYAYYNPEIVMANDYYAFGMQRKHYDAGIYYYRYGFNGKENDRDVKGEGNQQDYGMRIYDPRVGRFYSIDPLQKKYPELTPYQFASNSPVRHIDLDGLEALLPNIFRTGPIMVVQTGVEVATWAHNSHQRGMRNWDMAEYAKQQAIKQGRKDGDGITTYTKSLVYIGAWWYDGGINNTINPVENAKDAKKDFQQGHYVAGTLGILALIPGLTEMKVFKYAGKFGKCAEYATEFISKYEKTIIKAGGTVEKFEINIGKNGLIGTAEQQLSNNGFHQFVEVTKDGKSVIFDNLHPKGVLKEDYIQSLGAVKREGDKVVQLSGENVFKEYTKKVK